MPGKKRKYVSMLLGNREYFCRVAAKAFASWRQILTLETMLAVGILVKKLGNIRDECFWKHVSSF